MSGATVKMSGLALDWITGDDTGISSRAIWHHMTGRADRYGDMGFYPRDPDDFGRCHRLLVIMPEWRERVGEMAAHGREWAALVAVWQGLTDSYCAELRAQGIDPDGRWIRGFAPETYDLMQVIIKGAA